MYQGLSLYKEPTTNTYSSQTDGIDASITLYDDKEPFVVTSIKSSEKIINTDYFWCDMRLFCPATDNDTIGQKYNCRTTGCTASFTIREDDEGFDTTYTIRDHKGGCKTQYVTIKKRIRRCKYYFLN